MNCPIPFHYIKGKTKSKLRCFEDRLEDRLSKQYSVKHFGIFGYQFSPPSQVVWPFSTF